MKWITVAQETPVDTDLLLTISTGKVVVGMRHANFGWDWAETHDALDAEAEVTHWMRFPLPAANSA